MSFFDAKRDWSRYKDFILGYYLVPYLPKVATRGRPIAVFDCFAGPGKFNDGALGSPLLIAAAVKGARDRKLEVTAHLFEEKRRTYDRLQENIHPFHPHVIAHCESFHEAIPLIEATAKTHSLFVYLDPFGVRPITADSIQRILATKSDTSVELLMNFNVAALVRNAEAAVKNVFMDSNTLWEGHINEICGGEYWRDTIRSSKPYHDKVADVLKRYVAWLSTQAKFVMSYDVREHNTTQSKYHLLFCSNNTHAVELMNDIMCKARTEFLRREYASSEMLFDARTDEERHDVQEVQATVIQKLNDMMPCSRGEFLWACIRGMFGMHERKHYRQAVQDLLRSGAIRSATGKVRINDEVILYPNKETP